MTYSLTNSLAYLLNRTGARTGSLFARRLLQFGITLPMYRVMAALLERGDHRLSDLSTTTSIELSTLSRLVSTMIGRRLVSRERVEGDGRTVTISLTEAGHALVNRLVPIAVHHEQVSLRDLPPDVVAQLKRHLISIHDNLDALEDELPAVTTATPQAPARRAAGPGAYRALQMTSLPETQ